MRGLEQPGSFLFVPKRSMVGREKSPVWLGPVAKNLLVSTSLGAGARRAAVGPSPPGWGRHRPSRLRRWHWV